MNINVYLPAVILMASAIPAFIMGVVVISAGFSDKTSFLQTACLGAGLMLAYSSPAVLFIGLGIQVAHWI